MRRFLSLVGGMNSRYRFKLVMVPAGIASFETSRGVPSAYAHVERFIRGIREWRRS